jgi:hypothetical protein
MNVAEFEQTLSKDEPPPLLAPPVLALWWDAKQAWYKAHDQVQAADDRAAAWVHAYLHRKEGDLGNAAYWYHRANRPVAQQSLAEEWRTIAGTLLSEADR